MMTEVNKIIDNLNIPKQILDKSENLFRSLFGPSINEMGGLIADNVRLRRFKNQIRIFSKAQKILRDKNIQPSKVSLKVLAPLIECSSLEENKTLQEKWANLIAHILEGNKEESFNQAYIRILNSISSEEAKILDYLFSELIKRKELSRKEALKSVVRRKSKEIQKKLFGDTSVKYAIREANFLDFHIFSISTVAQALNIDRETTRFYIANLVALGSLRWKIKIDISSRLIHDKIENQVESEASQIFDYSSFIFTHLGEKFVKTCKR